MSTPLHIGTVTGPRGLKGHVKLVAFSPDSPAWVAGQPVIVGTTPRIIREIQHHPKGLVVRFEGVTDRTGAEALVKQRVTVDPASLPPLHEDEFYYRDLEGLQAQDEQGKVLGTIDRVVTMGQELLLILDPRGDEILVPMTLDPIVSIDLEGRIATVHIPPELLELGREEGSR